MNWNRNAIFRKVITVPVYDCTLVISVAKDLALERKQWEKWFGPGPDSNNYDGLACWSGGHRFAIFLSVEGLTADVIAREVFHVTHRIINWSGAGFDIDHQESAALLCGHLMKTVAKYLNPIIDKIKEYERKGYPSKNGRNNGARRSKGARPKDRRGTKRKSRPTARA